MSSKQPESPPVVSAAFKDNSRDSRLSFRKFGEHQLRREFKEIAIEKCRDQIQAFGQCATDSGLLVVFKCKSFNRDVQECMRKYNSPEEFEKFKAENEDLLMKKIPGSGIQRPS
jgi:hypothetical protein